MKRPALIMFVACSLLIASCGEPTSTTATSTDATTAAPTPTPEPHPADRFLASLAEHCGQAYAGRIVANEPKTDSDPFDGKTLVMHVRECGGREVKVPFHVGDDHSRTWVLTRTESGLRLKHDHRHADGSEDAVTMYGGDTAKPGTEIRQEFPVDEFSKEMFTREDLAVSVTNTWAMEIEPRKMFAYELARPGRLFRVEFDLTTPVPPPPTPWGHPEQSNGAGRR